MSETTPPLSNPPPGPRYRSEAESQPPPPTGEPVLPHEHVPWGPVDALLGILVVIGLLFAGALLILPITGTDGLDATLGSQAILEIALVATAYFFAVRRGAPHPFNALGLRKPHSGWMKTAALGYAVYFGAVLVIIGILGSPEQNDVANQLGFDQNTFAAITAAILIVVVAPICEEIWFRGFFFAGMRSALPFLPAALISALIFGAVHLSDANLIAGLQLTILGLILATVYERTDSLWSNIAIHMFNNAIAFTIRVST